MGYPAAGLRHFSIAEFGRPHLLDEGLLELIDEVRDRTGCPIKVINDHRTPEENEAIGGFHNSPHLRGKALDVAPVPYTAANRLALIAAVLDLWTEGRWPRLGLGIYNGHIHVDKDTELERPFLWTGISR